MKVVPIVRRRSTLLLAGLALAVTACMDLGSAMDPEDICANGSCAGWGLDIITADSLVIVQNDTTIARNDSLLVRVNVYPDSANFYIVDADPLGSGQLTLMRREGTNTDVWKLRPATDGTIRVIASNFVRGDTLVVQVARAVP